MAGTITVSGMAAGLPFGEQVFGPITITGAQVIGESLSLALNMGNNVIAVPLGAVAVMILPPANNTATLTLHTSLNNTDAGLPLNPGLVPFVYPFPLTAPTTITLNAQAAISAFTTVVFI